MQSLTRYLAVFILMIVLSGCGIGKLLKRHVTHNSERRDVESASQIRNAESVLAERGIMFSDSSQHLYRVTIFPLDSFSYSAHQGFNGRARRIEISGAVDRMAKGKMYEKNLVKRATDTDQTFSEKSRTVDRSVSREVTRRSGVGFIAIVLVIALILGWCCWKLRLRLLP